MSLADFEVVKRLGKFPVSQFVCLILPIMYPIQGLTLFVFR